MTWTCWNWMGYHEYVESKWKWLFDLSVWKWICWHDRLESDCYGMSLLKMTFLTWRWNDYLTIVILGFAVTHNNCSVNMCWKITILFMDLIIISLNRNNLRLASWLSLSHCIKFVTWLLLNYSLQRLWLSSTVSVLVDH